jgi:arylsulfatase A-like enzyme
VTLRLPAVVLVAALLGCGEAPAPAAGDWPLTLVPAATGAPIFERVVLVTLDTLRADHVSSYGYPRATTPFLDSLAARGVRFTRAQAAVSHTGPSHATMLTGLVPALHGVVHNGGSLPAEAIDLAELFTGAGFETAAALHVKFLAGVAASFGHVAVRTAGPKGEVLSGQDVVDAALAWAKKKRTSERFFLWVHLYDPHRWKELALESARFGVSPWKGATPEGFTRRLAELHGLPLPVEGEPWTVDWVVEDEKRGAHDFDFTSAAGFLRAIDAYDAFTLFADQQVARLHAELEQLALPGRTLWIVTADHGEGLASHGIAGHGGRIYQEQLAVPLVVHASDGSLAPRVVAEPVSHVDFFATLAATLGHGVIGAPGLYEGRSLWPLLTGAPSDWPARTLFAQRRPAENDADPDRAAVYALRDGRHKYILHEPGPDEFYDLAADPLERSSLGEDDPTGARLRAELEQRLRLFETFAPFFGGDEVPEEWLDELRDLGYVR